MAATTLASLRRKICTALQMPFYRRFLNGYLDMAASGCTTTKITNSSLTQKDKFWDGSWFYRVNTLETSLIRSFNANENSFMLEVPLATSPVTGEDFEILTGWNAIDIHYAINRVIEDSGKTFPDVVFDTSLVLQDEKLEYTISGLTRVPWIVTKVFLENKTAKRGTVASATSTTVVFESSSVLSDVTTAANFMVSIYKGTGAGQQRSLVSVSGATADVAAWTTVPDSTSKYALWDTTEQLQDWIFIDDFRVDFKESPTAIKMANRRDSLLGMRIGIEYMSVPLQLSTEAGTTLIPEGYLIPSALSFLFGQRISNVKADREVNFAESDRYAQMAKNFLVVNRPMKQDVSLRSPFNGRTVRDSNNPLNW